MKLVFAPSVLIVLLCTYFACSQQKKQANQPFMISIEGEVFQESDINFLYPAKSQLAYRVKVSLKNTGEQTLEFDQIETAFVPQGGTPLKQMSGIRRKGSQQNEKVTLEPGSVKEFPAFTSDGYTNDLISDARGRPLRFSVSLLSLGQRLFGPTMAVLPDIKKLSTLPSYHQSLSDKKVKGFPLTFSLSSP
ncbi:MAG: hypothetical protein V1799_00635 [bacterium]